MERVEHYFDPITGKPMMRARKFDLCPVCRGWINTNDCEACGGNGVIERHMGFVPSKIPISDLVLHHKYYDGTSIDHSSKEKKEMSLSRLGNLAPFDMVDNPSNPNATPGEFNKISGEMWQGIMPHHSGYPVSRDWEQIDCKADCQWSVGGKCYVPSLAKLGEDGRCQGFQPKDAPAVKPEEKISRKIRLD
jgi:hypothetical protein